MSGGSLDYVYFKLEEASEVIKEDPNVLYRAFCNHLDKVAEALKAIEWYYSGDSGPEAAEEAIRNVLGDLAPYKEMEVLRSDAQGLKLAFEKYIEMIDSIDLQN